MMDVASYALVGGAALAAGAVNAIAGGGSLITFPALVAAGFPSVGASITNTVALCPGYLGATLAQRRDLVGQGARAWRVLPIAAVGGVAGAALLLATGEAAFDIVVPFLILFAAVLLALQDRVRTFLVGRTPRAHATWWAALPVGVSAINGGYFGAGMGVMILAGLGVVIDDSLIRINALKQSVSLAVNVAAALVFIVSGRLDWRVVGVMAVGALAGGVIGGAIASRVPANVLRWTIVVGGVVLAGVYFARW
jgi:uncharacterized membrane protein YfcA